MKRTMLAIVVIGAAYALSPVGAEEPPVGLSEVDVAVDPCGNFYAYACGAWMKSNPIPSDQSSWDSFAVLEHDNQEVLHAALEKAVAEPVPGNRRAGDFYGACMDEKTTDAKGWSPVVPMLDRVAALSDKQELAELLATLHLDGIDAYFVFGTQTDFEDSRQDIAVVAQAGLGLPNRDFYLRDGEKDVARRQDYVAHVARMFGLVGDAPDAAQAKARTVLRIETALARASLPLADLNDPQKVNHKKPEGELARLMPDFSWDQYLQVEQSPPLKTLNIAEPDFLQVVEASLAGESLADIKVYLAWHVLHARARWLGKPFADENFAFYGKTLTGAAEQKPRWSRCVELTDEMLGEDLGRYFVDAAFGPEHKARTLEMVKDIKQALDADIDTLAWMSPATRKQAHGKLAAIVDKIGYPDHWRDYSALEIKPYDLVGNIERATRFENLRDNKKIGQVHDKSEWQITPPTVNAYYDPSENDIHLPAGILQPPFFTLSADDAVNYGAIGVVIGHEITHGFDDQGRQYDKDGNLKDWWTKADAERFKRRAACFIDQYGAYTAIDDVKQNGRATLGENLADNGGLRIALAALHKRLAGKPGDPASGFTPNQRFFLGFARSWCTNMRDDFKRTLVMSDVHSLPEYRVNGTLSNSEAFAKAFHCKATDPMVRGEKACRIW